MNKRKWSRVTLVLDCKTASNIRFLSAALNTTVSAVARDVLSEPVAFLADNVRGALSDPSPEHLEAMSSRASAEVDTAYRRLRGVR
jgi:hypothetical protein